jgi:uncharacterized protein (TIRG00374 family)
MSKALAFALKVGVSLLLVGLLLRAVDLGQLRHDLARLDLRHLALLASACWAGQFACALRWRRFAASLGMQERYRPLVAMYFVGMLFNIGLPSLVGGDAVKAYMLSRRTGAPLARGIASVLQDRAAGLASLIVYGCAAVLLHPLVWRGIPLWVLYAATWAGIAAVVLVVWRGDLLYAAWLRADRPGLLRKALAHAAEFHRALATMRLSAGGVLEVTALSFLNSAIVLWVFQQVSVAAGHPIDLVAFSALFPLMTLVTMAPVTLGGLGIREWTYVEALGLLGIPHETALAVALTTSALLIAINLPGALLLPSVSLEMPDRVAGPNGRR